MSLAAGEERRVEVAAALDLGCEEGREDALADLLRDFASRSAALGRQSVIADLEHLPEVARRLGDLDPRGETRTLEWSPYLPVVPKTLGECHLDLRYWRGPPGPRRGKRTSQRRCRSWVKLRVLRLTRRAERLTLIEWLENHRTGRR